MPVFDSRWPCTFNVVCALFFVLGTRNLPNWNAVSGEIQAFERVGFALGMSISCVILVYKYIANANAFSDGIWA